MITYEQIHTFEEHTAVLCKDGTVGLLIGWPPEMRKSSDPIIQVPGELDSRRISLARLNISGNGLYEDGAPIEKLLEKGMTFEAFHNFLKDRRETK